MKCINRVRLLIVFLLLASCFCLCGCMTKEPESKIVTEFEKDNYNANLYEGKLFAQELCVSPDDTAFVDVEYPDEAELHAAALFDLADHTVLYSYCAHEKLYPASVTKIMTALIALEKGNLEDQVTISSHAAAAAFPPDASVCGLVEGQVWSLKDLLNALMIRSGNDAAAAIAEHIGGSEEAFVSLMNIRARELMANNTHFMNPHGLHDDAHYTTAYDIYLIFKECIKDERFIDIISSNSYTASYVEADGSAGSQELLPTNYYARGLADRPENVTIVGGKTGTTGEAGNCLVLLEQDENNRSYISIIMGAPDKAVLYADMTSLILAIPSDAPAENAKTDNNQ